MDQLKAHGFKIAVGVWALLCVVVYFFLVGGAQRERDQALVQVQQTLDPLRQWAAPSSNAWDAKGPPRQSLVAYYQEEKARRAARLRDALRRWDEADAPFDALFHGDASLAEKPSDFHNSYLDQLDALEKKLSPARVWGGAELIGLTQERYQRLKNDPSGQRAQGLEPTFDRPERHPEAGEAVRVRQHQFWLHTELLLLLAELKLAHPGDFVGVIDRLITRAPYEHASGLVRCYPFQLTMRFEPRYYHEWLTRLLAPSTARVAVDLEGHEELLQRRGLRIDVVRERLTKAYYAEDEVVAVEPNEEGFMPADLAAREAAVLTTQGAPRIVVQVWAEAYDLVSRRELARRLYHYATADEATRDWPAAPAGSLEDEIAKVLAFQRFFCPFCDRQHLNEVPWAAGAPELLKPQTCATCGRTFKINTNPWNGRNVLEPQVTDWYNEIETTERGRKVRSSRRRLWEPLRE